MALPVTTRGVTVTSNYLAVGCATGGVMIWKLPGERWEHLTFGTNKFDNIAHAIRADDRWLWVGGYKSLRVIDTAKLRVVAECKFIRDRVRWIAPAPTVVWFITDGPMAGQSSLYRLT